MSLILGLPLLMLFVAATTAVLILGRLGLRLVERLFPAAVDTGQRPDPRCVECNYNLRGTLAAHRQACPECGRAIELPLAQSPRS
jgi:hypothetical protein